MRYRRLLFVAVLSLLSGATPVYAALGIEPRRLPPAMEGGMDMVEAKLPIPELDQAVSNYDPEQRDYLIRTIAFEAADEADEGKAAVAHVILNRKRSGRWGDNIKDVVTRPWQFEPWMTRRTEMERLSPDDPRYEDAARIADAVLNGQTPIQPRARRTSSIRQSFGKGGAVPCRHGHKARGSQSAGTPSTTLMRIVPGELHYRWAIWQTPMSTTPPASR